MVQISTNQSCSYSGSSAQKNEDLKVPTLSCLLKYDGVKTEEVQKLLVP